jgi:phytoene dehydrogenase-like protein
MTSPTYKTKERSKQALPEHVDVAIIGAGPGGLMCAAYLAQAGYQVACFDGHYVAGGCATQFERGQTGARYNFDIGLHYVGDCESKGTIPTLLRGLGIELDWLPLDPDGFDTLVFPDMEFKIPANHEVYRDRLLQYFPAEKKGIDRYMRFLLDVHTISNRMERSEGRLTAGTGIRTLLKHRSLLRYQNKTLETVFEQCTRNPKLRAVLGGQHGDYALPPSRVSAVLHAGLANHYFKGAFYPRGGGQTLANSIAESVEEHGGSIHLRKVIRQVLIEKGKAVGVVAEDANGTRKEVRANVVVSNADIKKTLLELVGPEHLPRDWVTRTRGMEMPYGIFMTCLGVEKGLGDQARNANYWAFDSYDTESFYKQSKSVKDFNAPGVYITSASMKDPETQDHAPEGVDSVEVMTMMPGNAQYWGIKPDMLPDWDYRRDEFYNLHKDRIEENLIERMDQIFPGSGARVVYRESATPVTHSRFTRATTGGGYGIACTPEQFLNNRPSYRGPIGSFYLCGASTRAGHGIVGAMSSGYISARIIARDLGRPISSAYS